MKQILILVEGQTEEQYIKNVLNPYFLNHNIGLTPTIINTKIIKGGNNFKGGLNNYNQVKRDLKKLFADKSILVTTFFDFYALPNDFPGYKNLSQFSNSFDKVKFLEKSLFEDIQEERFIPFIQLHEYESLLFSSITGFKVYFSSRPMHIQEIEKVMNQFPNPEDINDNPTTAPSKRLISIFPEYNKPLQGVLIAMENGITESLNKCPHFNEWINKLLSLA